MKICKLLTYKVVIPIQGGFEMIENLVENVYIENDHNDDLIENQENEKAPVDDSSISRYLIEINDIPVLSKEEEIDLAKRVLKNDDTARQKLVKSNLRYVVKLAKKYRNFGLPFIDLINEGNVGLMQAVDRFDHEKGYRFLTYASWWIKQSILSALSEKTRLIRLPHNKTDRLRDIQKYKTNYLSENGEPASNQEISNALGISVKVLENMINASKTYVPIDTPIKNNNTEYFLSEILVNEKQNTPETDSIEQSLKKSIEKSFKNLTSKESLVLIHRYGLNSNEPKTLKQIGKMLNLSKERIRQIEKKALQKMQNPENKEILEAFLSN